MLVSCLRQWIDFIEGTKMTEVKTFKIDQKFSGTEDLYRYLIKNVDLIGKSIGVQIQKPIKSKPFCIVGKEKITERNILFLHQKAKFLKI